MTAMERLAGLERLGAEQLAAARRSDLDAVSRLEAARREIIASFDAAELRRLAELDDAAVSERLRRILAGEQRLVALLRARLAAQGQDLSELARRRDAEKAYRGI